MIGIVLALTMLIVGSIIDVWKREIHDYYWIGFGSVGFLLLFLDPDFTSNLLTIGFALIIAPFVILMWRIGMFGGADAFALIALAVIAPMATFSENAVTPFTTLSNAAILFVFPFDRRSLCNALWSHNPIKRELDQATRVYQHACPCTSSTGTLAAHGVGVVTA